MSGQVLPSARTLVTLLARYLIDRMFGDGYPVQNSTKSHKTSCPFSSSNGWNNSTNSVRECRMYMHFKKQIFEIKILRPLTNKVKGHTVNSSFVPSILTVYHRPWGNEVSKIFIISKFSNLAGRENDENSFHFLAGHTIEYSPLNWPIKALVISNR